MGKHKVLFSSTLSSNNLNSSISCVADCGPSLLTSFSQQMLFHIWRSNARKFNNFLPNLHFGVSMWQLSFLCQALHTWRKSCLNWMITLPNTPQPLSHKKKKKKNVAKSRCCKLAARGDRQPVATGNWKRWLEFLVHRWMFTQAHHWPQQTTNRKEHLQCRGSDFPESRFS